MGKRAGSLGSFRHVVWGAIATTALALVPSACESGSDHQQGSSGEGAGAHAGSSPQGGSSSGSSSHQGGAAGTDAGAPAAGAAQAGAMPGGGSATQGGSSSSDAGAVGEPGGAGNASGGSECMVDDDCAVQNDCCDCAAVPKADQPAKCERVCVQSSCAARGLTGTPVQCVGHRCVFELSCDTTQVMCKAATPKCDPGFVPSVKGTCWGPCIPIGDCARVPDCSFCAKGEVCVDSQDSPLSFKLCAAVSPECAAAPTCECVDACSHSCSDDDGIACFCPVC